MEYDTCYTKKWTKYGGICQRIGDPESVKERVNEEALTFLAWMKSFMQRKEVNTQKCLLAMTDLMLDIFANCKIPFYTFNFKKDTLLLRTIIKAPTFELWYYRYRVKESKINIMISI